MRSVELFVGAGGLALGATIAGFKHQGVIEWNSTACETILHNQRSGAALVRDWPVMHTDARLVDYSQFESPIDLVAGGPPCQPFSLAGKHRGFEDERDMFSEAVRAIRELRPRAFIFENVKGLLRSSFAEYFEYIVLQLTYPELVRKDAHDWVEHKATLEERHTSGRVDQELRYNVVFTRVNAADYGVPQRRERVIIVGFRSDLGVKWSFPSSTHSLDALLYDQWVTGEYWDRHLVPVGERYKLSGELASRVADLRQSLFRPTELPWRTVRDAICDLPDPEKHADNGIPNHRFIAGARSYPGHTGSQFDLPAKTLKAGDHGVPGGENTLLFPNGSVRYLTVRESARLQTFPDDYVFECSWGESMRQLGNAVPVLLASSIAQSVGKRLGMLAH